TAPLVCARLSVRALVLVAPMIPASGESASQWWERAGQPEAQRDFALREGRDPDAEPSLDELFLHDLPPEPGETELRYGECQASTPVEQPWPLAAWPYVPTHVVACRHDRLLPVEFQRGIARERLSVPPDELYGGDLAILGNPGELARRLASYV